MEEVKVEWAAKASHEGLLQSTCKLKDILFSRQLECRNV